MTGEEFSYAGYIAQATRTAAGHLHIGRRIHASFRSVEAERILVCR
jgi:hypothetical protein